MIGARTIEQTLHVAPVISSQMEEAIQLWADMYKNNAPWLKEPNFNDPERVVSLGLPAMIASEKARMVLLEWKILRFERSLLGRQFEQWDQELNPQPHKNIAFPYFYGPLRIGEIQPRRDR